MIARYLFSLLVPVIFFCDIHAQFDDQYGRLRPQDIDIKECSFDPSASLVITLDQGSTEYNPFGEPVTFRHVRMKVLKEDGLKYANFAITYPSIRNILIIDQLEGKCINVAENGYINEYPVNKKTIFNTKVNKYYSQITFAFPQVKVGSILEYRYRCTSTKTWSIEDWNFQQKFPVYQSSYLFKSHPRIEISYALQKRAEYPVIIKPDNEKKSILFQMNNIPALDDEPYMDGRESYLQKIRFQITHVAGWDGLQSYNTSWGQIAGQLLAYDGFGKYLNSKSKEVNEFVSNLTGNNSDFSKMKKIHDYVRKNIAWDKTESFTTNETVKDLWKTKRGNSASINLLMVNMLRSAGLKADPILISERGNGRVDRSFPYLDQFTNVFAIVTIENKLYYLDGTDKLTPCSTIPSDILNTMGFVVGKEFANLLPIEERENKYKNIVAIEASLQEDGKITGSVQIINRDYARISTIKNYKEAPKDFVENYLKKNLVNIQLDSFRIANIDDDSLGIIQNFNFKTSIQNSGEYDFATLNMFTGFTSNPFIAESRISDVNFGFRKSYTVNYVLSLPANRKINTPPQNILLQNEDKALSFSRQVIYNEQTNQLITRMKIDINKSLIKPDQYTDLKDFFKKLNNVLDEQLIINRK